VTVTLARSALDRVLVGESTLADEEAGGEIKVEPEMAPVQEFLSLLDEFDIWFNIIEP
jgi:alkyl sulfatase BDS1-like metallo-beta-lactamase superfamily hydrolase